MQHDGRFRRSTKLSAVLFPSAVMLAESIPSDLIIIGLENDSRL